MTICGCQSCVEQYQGSYEEFSSSHTGWQSFSQNAVDDADRDIAGYQNDSPPVNQFLNENLHLVWYGHFHRLFRDLAYIRQHCWYLEPMVSEEEDYYTLANNPIFKSRQLAKVRFICEDCGKAWTSMRGVALFSVIQTGCNTFALRYTLYGQKCSNPLCKDLGFQSAIWYPEEVIKALDYVHEEVMTKIYGLVRPSISPKNHVGLRLGRPQHSHESDNCQACAKGICPVAQKALNRQNNNLDNRTRYHSFTSSSVGPGRRRDDSFSSEVSSLATVSLSEEGYSVCDSPDLLGNSMIKPTSVSTPLSINRMAVSVYGKEMN